jgi:VWFA-related protein
MRLVRRSAFSLASFALTSSLCAQQPPQPAAQQLSPPVEQPPQQDATPPPGQGPPPLLTAHARAVVLDVVVTDKHGNVVHGLQSTDFHLVEDKQPQTLNSFHEQTFSAADAPKPPQLPPNSFTNYTPTGTSGAYTVFLIDTANNRVEDQAYARSELIDFMKTIPPGNPVAIFELESTGMHLVQGFSSDPAVLLQAARSKRDELVIPTIGLGQRGYPAQRLRQDALSQGLKSMGRYLAAFPGRKNLIWLSGSIPQAYWDGNFGTPFPDTEDFSSEVADATDSLVLSRVAVYPIDVRGIESYPGANASHSGVPPNFSTRNLPIPTNPATSFEIRRFFEHGDISDVANSTGGKAFYNTNDIKRAMVEALDSGSNYYTIAYTPTNNKWDGRFRNIKIEVSRPDLHLEYRHGYFARAETSAQENHASADETVTAFTPATNQPSQPGSRSSFVDSMQLGAVPATEVIFTASLAPGTSVQKIDEKATPPPPARNLRPILLKKPLRDYNILFAVNPSSVHFTATPDGIRHGKLAFVTVIYDDQGIAINSSVTNITLNLKPDSYDKVMHRVLGTKQTLDVPAKGNYFFRFGVHDALADRSGAMEIPVDDVKLGVAGPSQTLAP